MLALPPEFQQPARQAPGNTFKFFSDARGGPVTGVNFRCPQCEVMVTANFTSTPGRPRWSWDGDREAPTLHPSFTHRDDACGWTGWLIGGQFKGMVP